MKENKSVINEILEKIQKQFGKESLVRMNSRATYCQEDVISTGSVNLDTALGIGGLPRGRIVEIYGHESSGKTTLALTVVAELQKIGGNAVFIDAEHALDAEYAGKIGIKMEDLLLSQPDCGEQALEIADSLISTQEVDVLVIDSVAALVPKAEILGEMGDVHVGLQARLMSKALRKLTGSVRKSNTLVIFINQIRSKIGVVFGNPETTSGGNALKFYATIRLEIKRATIIKKGEDPIGNLVRAKVVKNKLAPPFKTAEFEIIYGLGISLYGEIIDNGVKLGIIERSGSWYSHKTDKLGQGRENACQYLLDHPELFQSLYQEIREQLLPKKKLQEALTE